MARQGRRQRAIADEEADLDIPFKGGFREVFCRGDEHDLVGTLDLLERDPEGQLAVVDLKTATRKDTDLQVEASLQLSIYSYATSMNGLADREDLRLRFDVLTKTKIPELHRYWTTRDRAANVRLYRLAAEILTSVDACVFPPRVGWHCQDCPVRSRCWAWG
jgi:CRISPR/Cas system-associated exonuclease Cas4 (RecB family)